MRDTEVLLERTGITEPECVENIYLVYRHTSPVGKSYIGRTKNLAKRNYQHMMGMSSSNEFQSAIKEFGWENFTHEVLVDNLSYEESVRIEKEMIERHSSTFPNGYNMMTGGAREGAGAKLKGDLKRKMITFRISPDLVERMKDASESQSDQIERALRNYYNW
jgi:group I intron endonuclease